MIGGGVACQCVGQQDVELSHIRHASNGEPKSRAMIGKEHDHHLVVGNREQIGEFFRRGTLHRQGFRRPPQAIDRPGDLPNVDRGDQHRQFGLDRGGDISEWIGRDRLSRLGEFALTPLIEEEDQWFLPVTRLLGRECRGEPITKPGQVRERLITLIEHAFLCWGDGTMATGVMGRSSKWTDMRSVLPGGREGLDAEHVRVARRTVPLFGPSLGFWSNREASEPVDDRFLFQVLLNRKFARHSGKKAARVPRSLV